MLKLYSANYFLFSNQATHNGLILNFLGGFEGSADVLHLPNCGGDGQDLEATYPKKKKVSQIPISEFPNFDSMIVPCSSTCNYMKPKFGNEWMKEKKWIRSQAGQMDSNLALR